MSVNHKTHSSSSIASSASSKDSTSSRSSAGERSSLSTPAVTGHGHGARHNIHSAPANFVSAGARGQTLSENATTTSSSSKAKTPRTEVPTARDAYEKEFLKKQQKARLEAMTVEEPEQPKDNGHKEKKHNKGCVGSVDLDFTYANVHTSGSRHGRKTIGTGSGAPNECDLM